MLCWDVGVVGTYEEQSPHGVVHEHEERDEEHRPAEELVGGRLKLDLLYTQCTHHC